VAARLPPDLTARVRAVLTPFESLIETSDWWELENTLRQGPVDLIVIDPSLERLGLSTADRFESAATLSLLNEFRDIPLIAYTRYTREAMRSLLPLARSGLSHVVLRGFDDTHERLRDLIDEAGARIIGRQLLDEVIPMLAEIEAPAGVIAAITRLFLAPRSFRTVPQLAEAAGRQRGQLDRWLRRAGLAPAKTVIVAARVAWAHHYAQSPANRFKMLAFRLGYPSALPLSRHIQWMTGMTPTTLRRTVTPHELVAMLLGRLVLRTKAHR
jgi:AraC-like DNA-binding protein